MAAIESIPLLPDIKRVWGPRDCVLLVHPNCLQTVLTFGEVHQRYEKKCNDYKEPAMEIAQYIGAIAFDNKQAVIDLVMESDYWLYTQNRQDPARRISGPFNSMKLTFQQCFNFQTRLTCPDNIRVHYADIRYTNIIMGVRRIVWKPFHDLDEVGEFNTWINQMEQQSVFKRQHEMVIQEFKGYNPLFGEQIRQKLGEEVKAIEGIGSVSSKEYQELLSSSKSFRDSLVNLLKAEDAGTTDEVIIAEKSLRSSAFKIETLLVGIPMPIMDLYSVLRMFHKYTKEPHIAKNIIYYAGYEHTQNVVAILKRIGYLTVDSFYHKNPRDQCIEVPDYNKLKIYLTLSGSVPE